MKTSLPDLAFFTEYGDLTDLPGATALLNEAALSGGKQFRPKLFFMMSECLGLSRESATPYAILAERIHNATLLHDDVIDESSLRRGKPTLNASGHNRRAILGGDLLLAISLRDIGACADVQILKDIFAVMVELVEGEWLQLEARQSTQVGERHLRRVAEKKTASLIAWCLSTPGRLAGLSVSNIEKLKTAGTHLGVAFQMVDDCLDFSETSGKPWGQDLQEGQLNFVTYALREGALPLRRELDEWVERGSSHAPSLQFKRGVTQAAQVVRRQIATEIEVCRHLLGSAPELSAALQVLDRDVLNPLLKAGQL